jgi:hypothetical protein
VAHLCSNFRRAPRLGPWTGSGVSRLGPRTGSGAPRVALYRCGWGAPQMAHQRIIQRGLSRTTSLEGSATGRTLGGGIEGTGRERLKWHTTGDCI